jgi:hypothetical protein
MTQEFPQILIDRTIAWASKLPADHPIQAAINTLSKQTEQSTSEKNDESK